MYTLQNKLALIKIWLKGFKFKLSTQVHTPSEIACQFCSSPQTHVTSFICILFPTRTRAARGSVVQLQQNFSSLQKHHPVSFHSLCFLLPALSWMWACEHEAVQWNKWTYDYLKLPFFNLVHNFTASPSVLTGWHKHILTVSKEIFQNFNLPSNLP